MGANTSGLRDDLDDLDNNLQAVDRAFATHRDDYSRFPSSSSLALRQQFDDHVTSYNSAAGSTTVNELQSIRMDLGNLKVAADQVVETQALTNLSVQRKLNTLTGEYSQLADGKCDVTFTCPLQEAYASAAAVTLLQTAVENRATTSSVNVIMERTKSLEDGQRTTKDRLHELEHPTDPVVNQAQLSAKLDTSAFSVLEQRVGAAAGDGQATATGLFNALSTKADQTDLQALVDAVGAAATGNTAATGLHLATTSAVADVTARVDALEADQPVPVVHLPVSGLVDGAIGMPMKWTACYPDDGRGTYRKHIEKECRHGRRVGPPRRYIRQTGRLL